MSNLLLFLAGAVLEAVGLWLVSPSLSLTVNGFLLIALVLGASLKEGKKDDTNYD